MTLRKKHQMHKNSLASYASLRPESITKAIVDLLIEHGNSLTDKSILYLLHQSGVLPNQHEMNLVRPKITSLIKRGILVEHGKATCLHSGKTVRTVKFKE